MSGLRPSFDVDRRPVLAGAGITFAVVIAPMLRLEPSLPVLLAGGVGGAVAGGLSGRYGNAMNNGLVAGALGGLLACLVVALYGSYASYQLGFGLDSRFAAQYGFFALSMAVFVVPFHAVEGALVAAVADSVRQRIETPRA